jgi:hypothetical protein
MNIGYIAYGYELMFDLSAIDANLKIHKNNPEISTRAYVHGLMDEIEKSIDGKKVFYLDTRFWVYLRDAAMGRPRLASHEEMLRILRTAVASGRAICPVTDAHLVELFKQTDSTTKAVTAKLMDELGAGVALIAEYSRVQEEIFTSFENRGAGAAENHRRPRVWARPVYAYGARVPVSAQLGAGANQLFQKVAVDSMWRVSVEEWVASQEGTDPPVNPMKAAADDVNARKARYASEIRSFEEALLTELAGSLRVNGKWVAAAYERSVRLATQDERSQHIRTAQGARLRNVLVNLFKYRRSLMARHLPGIYIHASCHAAVRWDRTRKVDDHDLLDFHHATAALPYCDAFFTDGPMRALLTSQMLGLDKLFGTYVESEETRVLDYLKRCVGG